MKSYLQYKQDIKGYADVLATVSVTEKIAASSIHFLKIRNENLLDYVENIRKVLSRLNYLFPDYKSPLQEPPKQTGSDIIVIGGDKGLVGNLYHRMVSTLAQERVRRIYVIGKRIADYLKEEGRQVYKVYEDPGVQPESEKITMVTDEIFNDYKSGRSTKVDILFPKFVSLGRQEPTLTSFLPFNFETTEEEVNKEALGFAIFEPSSDKVYKYFQEKYVQLYFYQLVFESKLSELSARTVDSENAVNKTKKMLSQLRLMYFRNRREFITERQLESFSVGKIS